MLKRYFSSSIGKKQTVAVTGFLLILFLIVHLAGNLLIYKGPEAINIYSHTLHSLGPLLWVMELGLTAIFVIHIVFTAMVVVENKKARPIAYSGKQGDTERSLATRLMPYTGTILLIYVISHLFDFTFADPTGADAFINGQNLGLYGLIVNEFSDPYHVLWYVVAMAAVGFHLVHAIQSLCQTFGWNHPTYTPFIKKMSLILGLLISISFAAIPVYVWLVIAPN
jgi:succinate dehydrogenase / fumarate reductase cytochrome b subunit